ncbi:unnamed protein product [Zymoseptoria tritici ST99CH_3D1]|nr:unnamed protein product [Zymoseptoria tritici ST99CH_3D1]
MVKKRSKGLGGNKPSIGAAKPPPIARGPRPSLSSQATGTKRERDDTDDTLQPADDGLPDPGSPGLLASELDPVELTHKLNALNSDAIEAEGDEQAVDDYGYDALQELADLASYQNRAPVRTIDDEQPEAPLDDEDEDETADPPAPPTNMPPPSLPTAAIPGFGPDTSVALPQPRLSKQISNFELAVGLWSIASNISRVDYSQLRGILEMAAAAPNCVQLLREIPGTIDTIKAHVKGTVPLLDIRMKEVSLNLHQQASVASGKKQSKASNKEFLYYFDLMQFFQAYLATPVSEEKLFEGLGHFVDAPVQLWHSRAWHSTIRISSGKYARYALGPNQDEFGPGPEPMPPTALTAARTRTNGNLFAAYDQAMVTYNRTKSRWITDSKAAAHRGWLGGPIFQSDFVLFRCGEDDCACVSDDSKMHGGRVLGIGHDHRSVREVGVEEGDITVMIQPVIPAAQIPAAVASRFSPALQANEVVLLEGDDRYVAVNDISAARSNTFVHYAFRSALNPQDLPSGSPQYFIRRIMHADTLDAPANTPAPGPGLDPSRPVWQRDPIRGELEIMHFGRQYLVDTFSDRKDGRRVQSVPLVMFIDDFGLYRNMYRALTGFYMLFGSLSNKERNRRANCIPLTLGPHGSNMEEMIEAIGGTLSLLDRGAEMTIAGEDRLVCASTLMFIGDMKQQQTNAGFLGVRSAHGCRFCVHANDTWEELRLDMVAQRRYHHEVMRIRRFMEALPNANAKKNFIAGKRIGGVNGTQLRADHTGKAMMLETIPLERINPAGDRVMGVPSDAPHSEGNGLTKMAFQILNEHVFTDSAMLEFSQRMRTFPFPPGWGRLQSTAHYIGSYKLGELVRLSIVGAILLRCWLKESHLRSGFAEALRDAMPNLVTAVESMTTERPVPASHMMAILFGRIANSNMLTMSDNLTTEQHGFLVPDLLICRDMFQGLCEAAAIAVEGRPMSRVATPTGTAPQGTAAAKRARTTAARGSRAATPTPGGSRAGTPADDQDQGDTGMGTEFDDGDGTVPQKTASAPLKARQLRAMKRRPNVHTGLHYAELRDEYGLISNHNVLIGEDRHREFKRLIYTTNKQNPERDLLQAINMQMSTRLVFQDGFLQSEPAATQQLKDIDSAIPGMFDRLMPRSERDVFTADDEDVDRELLVVQSDTVHLNVKCRRKLQPRFVQTKLGFPTRGDGKWPAWLGDSITQAFQLDYSRPAVKAPFVGKPVKWFKEVSYDDANTQLRETLHRGDFIQFRQDTQPARIDQAFTMEVQAGITRCFLLLTPTSANGQDPLTLLPTHQLGPGAQFVVGLPQINLTSSRRWIVPVHRAIDGPHDMDLGPPAEEAEAGQHLLDVTWNLTFL